MVSLENYAGREQSYVKHVFLESYLERLVHKTASTFNKIVYVDGFAGPWQSASERFEDTSFGIALNALLRAKSSWKEHGRDVSMSAHLVEREAAAYERLAQVPERYPEISVKTYEANFMAVLPKILRDLPPDAFTFFLIDPKGWRIPLKILQPMLERPISEIIFNFMFDFINRAASMSDPAVMKGLDELIPYGAWKKKLEEAERRSEGLTPDGRKALLVEAFSGSLAQLGKYSYVAETTVLRPLKDRPLYCLFYATRHPMGMTVFRDAQIKSLKEQSSTRAAAKIKHVEAKTGQSEIFESLHAMGPDALTALLRSEQRNASKALLDLTPAHPASIQYEILRAKVLTRHVITAADVNMIAAHLHKTGELVFPGWEKGRRVPQPGYRVHRGIAGG